MPLRRAQPLTFRPVGCSDAQDGTNAFPGAMQALTNLIPNPSTRGSFVPRPAAVSITSFGGITGAARVTAILQVGTLTYGMVSISSGGFNGKDQPFVFDTVSKTFTTVTIPGGAPSLPTSPPISGAWQPPIMALVAGRVMIAHSGFTGAGGLMFGWIDVSSFSDATKTGNLHSNTTIDNLSSSVLTAGWQVGFAIAGTGIPPNTTIVSIASNGLSIVISNAATATTAGVALTVTGGTSGAPLYGSGNTNGNPLFTPPVAVAQFNGRCWFALSKFLVFSDSLNPCQVTNATQALATTNGLAITALAPLQLESPITGGIIQSLIAFQGTTAMFQVTGDSATSTLAVNYLNVATGTMAPLSITPTPKGIMFVAPDGLRLLNFSANIEDPIGADGMGITVPFINAAVPSRMVACYNQGVVRITVRNSAATGAPMQEWWYDLVRQIWTGPHSFTAGLMQPLPSNSFIMTGAGIDAQLWQSDVEPTAASSYFENGAQLTFVFQPVLLPDNQDMAMNAVIETSFMVNLGQIPTLTVQALDEANNPLGTVTLGGSSAGTSIWGVFLWGQPWGGSTYMQQVRLAWPAPLVFKQMSLRFSGASVTGLSLGNIYMKYQILGYNLQQ